jgi:tetratricopeptide (TPR) repeat protein
MSHQLPCRLKLLRCRAGLCALWLALLAGTVLAAAPGEPSGASVERGPVAGLPSRTEPLKLHNPPSREQLEAERAELLDKLFARLHGAKSAEAAKVLEEAVRQLWLRSGSPTVDLLLMQAQKAMDAKKLDQAQVLLDTVTDIDPDFAEGWNVRARLHFLQGEVDRALEALDKVLELEPRHFNALVTLGDAKRALDDRSGALEAFREALAINPFLEKAEDAIEQLEKEAGQPI